MTDNKDRWSGTVSVTELDMKVDFCGVLTCMYHILFELFKCFGELTMKLNEWS